MNQSLLEKLFERFDRDNSNDIDLREFEAAFAKYFDLRKSKE